VISSPIFENQLSQLLWRGLEKLHVELTSYQYLSDEIERIPTFHYNAISDCKILHNAQWKLDSLATCRICCGGTT